MKRERIQLLLTVEITYERKEDRLKAIESAKENALACSTGGFYFSNESKRVKLLKP